MTVPVSTICSAALTILGAEPITALDDESRNADYCNALWTMAYKSELRKYPWSFALKRVELPQNAVNPIFRYDFRYALPSDLLRLLNVVNTNSERLRDYKIEQGHVVTNATSVFIEYIFNESDSVQWDPMFDEVMVYKMAHQLAYTLPGHGTMIDRMGALYTDRYMQATTADASETLHDTLQGQGGLINTRQEYY